MNSYTVEQLSRKANELRVDILKMACVTEGGHIGGAFSIIDVLTGIYYCALKHDPYNPFWSERDRLIFSKGHGCLALYAVLADRGYFPKDQLELFGVDGSFLTGHPEKDVIPGVEVTTGSLGHGLSLGIGMALAAQMDKKNYRVFIVLGDGECNEGSVWEAIMSASQFKLDNLIAIFDCNKYESLNKVSEILNIYPLGEKLESFGWSVREINGHNMSEILNSFETLPYKSKKPSAIIAHTIKGKGVSFMENVPKWHAKSPDEREKQAALTELEQLLK